MIIAFVKREWEIFIMRKRDRFYFISLLCFIVAGFVFGQGNIYDLDYKVPDTINNLSESNYLDEIDWRSTDELLEYYCYYYPYLKRNRADSLVYLEDYLVNEFQGHDPLVTNDFDSCFFLQNQGKTWDELILTPEVSQESTEISGLSKIPEYNDPEPYKALMQEMRDMSLSADRFKDPFMLTDSVRHEFLEFCEETDLFAEDKLNRIYLTMDFMMNRMEYGQRYDSDEGTLYAQGAEHLCLEYENRGSCDGDCVSGMLLFIALAEQAGLNAYGGQVLIISSGFPAGLHSCALVELEEGSFITVDVGLMQVGVSHQRIDIMSREEFVLFQTGTQFPDFVRHRMFEFLMEYDNEFPLYLWKSILNSDLFKVHFRNYRKPLLDKRLAQAFLNYKDDAIAYSYLNLQAMHYYNDAYEYEKALDCFENITEKSLFPQACLEAVISFDSLQNHDSIPFLLQQYIDDFKPYDSSQWKNYLQNIFFALNYHSAMNNEEDLQKILAKLDSLCSAYRNFHKDILFHTKEDSIFFENDNVEYRLITENLVNPLPGGESIVLPPYTLIQTEEDEEKYFIPGGPDVVFQRIELGKSPREYASADFMVSAEELSLELGDLHHETVGVREYTFQPVDNIWDLNLKFDGDGEMYIRSGAIDQTVPVLMGGIETEIPCDYVYFNQEGQPRNCSISGGDNFTLETLHGPIIVANSQLRCKDDIALDSSGRITHAFLVEPYHLNLNGTDFTFLNDAEKSHFDITLAYDSNNIPRLHQGSVEQAVTVQTGRDIRSVIVNAIQFDENMKISSLDLFDDGEVSVSTARGNLILGPKSSYMDLLLDDQGRITNGYLSYDQKIGEGKNTLFLKKQDRSFEVEFFYDDKGECTLKYAFVDQFYPKKLNGIDHAIPIDYIQFDNDGQTEILLSLKPGESLAVDTIWGPFEIESEESNYLYLDDRRRITSGLLSYNSSLEINGSSFDFLGGTGKYDSRIHFEYDEAGDCHIKQGYVSAGSEIPFGSGMVRLDENTRVLIDKDGSLDVDFQYNSGTYSRGENRSDIPFDSIRMGDDFIVLRLADDLDIQMDFGLVHLTDKTGISFDRQGRPIEFTVGSDCVVPTEYGTVNALSGTVVRHERENPVSLYGNVEGMIHFQNQDLKVDYLRLQENGDIRYFGLEPEESFSLDTAQGTILLSSYMQDDFGFPLTGCSDYPQTFTIKGKPFVHAEVGGSDIMVDYRFSGNRNGQTYISQMETEEIPIDIDIGGERRTINANLLSFSSDGEIRMVDKIGDQRLEIDFQTKYGVLSTYQLLLDEQRVIGGITHDFTMIDYNGSQVKIPYGSPFVIHPENNEILLMKPLEGETLILEDGRQLECGEKSYIYRDSNGEVCLDSGDVYKTEFSVDDFYILKHLDKNSSELIEVLSPVEGEFFHGGTYYILPAGEWVLVQ